MAGVLTVAVTVAGVCVVGGKGGVDGCQQHYYRWHDYGFTCRFTQQRLHMVPKQRELHL